MGKVTPLKRSATVLHAKLGVEIDLPSRILRVSSDPNSLPDLDHAFLSQDDSKLPDGYATYFTRQKDSTPAASFATPKALHYSLPSSLNHLDHGDIVRINPGKGELWVMYRKSSPSNAMLVTERCNSWCVMCSQPPKAADDTALAREWLQAIPLMDPDSRDLGITGGEPTLLGELFLEIVAKCQSHLPKTALHVLSNGRNFTYLSLAKGLASIGHQDLMIGIPLYSDVAWRHEFVVQAPGSFDHTVRGILNLARCNIPVEIRIVLHRHTIHRLPQLAAYISRNFPFVAQVALMGLEPIGFAKTNFQALWVDPLDYHRELSEAVTCFEANGVNVTIYNHQLCVLPQSLWGYAVKSISDWKNIYVAACTNCSVQQKCGGFFHSAAVNHSRGIQPILGNPRESN